MTIRRLTSYSWLEWAAVVRGDRYLWVGGQGVSSDGERMKVGLWWGTLVTFFFLIAALILSRINLT